MIVLTYSDGNGNYSSHSNGGFDEVECKFTHEDGNFVCGVDNNGNCHDIPKDCVFNPLYHL